MKVVYKFLQFFWCDDVVKFDCKMGVYIDFDFVCWIDYKGKYFSVVGFYIVDLSFQCIFFFF